MAINQIGLESITEEMFNDKMKNFFQNRQFNRFYDLDSNVKNGEVINLEKNLCEKFNVKYSLAINSATQGLSITIQSLEIKNSEILLPFYSFSACPLAIIHSGNIPVIFNNDSELDFDIQDMENKISDNTKAIMLVYMRGLKTKYYNDIVKIAKKYKLKLIEDISQFDLLTFNNQLGWGGKSDAAVLSFQSKKIISGGEGGAIISNNKKMIENAQKFHDAAWDIRGNEEIDFTNHPIYPGSRMNEITAAIINLQINNLNELSNKLFRNKKIIEDIFSYPNEINHNNNGYNVHYNFKNKKDKLKVISSCTFPIYPEFLVDSDAHSYNGWHFDIQNKCKYENSSKKNIFDNHLIIQTPLSMKE